MGYRFKIIKMGKIILPLERCYEIRDNIMGTEKAYNKS